jgi:hypothetical protein
MFTALDKVFMGIYNQNLAMVKAGKFDESAMMETRSFLCIDSAGKQHTMQFSILDLVEAVKYQPIANYIFHTLSYSYHEAIEELRNRDIASNLFTLFSLSPVMYYDTLIILALRCHQPQSIIVRYLCEADHDAIKHHYEDFIEHYLSDTPGFNDEQGRLAVGLLEVTRGKRTFSSVSEESVLFHTAHHWEYPQKRILDIYEQMYSLNEAQQAIQANANHQQQIVWQSPSYRRTGR